MVIIASLYGNHDYMFIKHLKATVEHGKWDTDYGNKYGKIQPGGDTQINSGGSKYPLPGLCKSWQEHAWILEAIGRIWIDLDFIKSWSHSKVFTYSNIG